MILQEKETGQMPLMNLGTVSFNQILVSLIWQYVKRIVSHD